MLLVCWHIIYVTTTSIQHRKQCYILRLTLYYNVGELTLCFCPQDGTTALFLAAQEGKGEVVRLLIKAKALVNIRKKVCTSLFHPLTWRGEEIYMYYYGNIDFLCIISKLLQIQKGLGICGNICIWEILIVSFSDPHVHRYLLEWWSGIPFMFITHWSWTQSLQTNCNQPCIKISDNI